MGSDEWLRLKDNRKECEKGILECRCKGGGVVGVVGDVLV
jgi:hypothetical protein